MIVPGLETNNYSLAHIEYNEAEAGPKREGGGGGNSAAVHIHMHGCHLSPWTARLPYLLHAPCTNLQLPRLPLEDTEYVVVRIFLFKKVRWMTKGRWRRREDGWTSKHPVLPRQAVACHIRGRGTSHYLTTTRMSSNSVPQRRNWQTNLLLWPVGTPCFTPRTSPAVPLLQHEDFPDVSLLSTLSRHSFLRGTPLSQTLSSPGSR